MKRVAGTIVVLLSLRDATDALGKASPEVSHLSDFAWLKVPRLYYNSHAKCYWLGILDTQMICREEWQGSNPTVVVGLLRVQTRSAVIPPESRFFASTPVL